MPLFEYKCLDCKKIFEKLVSSHTNSVSCPKCSSVRVRRLISSFKSPNSNQESCSSCKLTDCSSCGPGG